MKQFAPCPKCSETNAEQMSFTWWGGLIGPKLLNHVKCLNCETTYNGKTGKDNTTNIVIYSVVVGLIVFVIIAVIIALMIAIMIAS